MVHVKNNPFIINMIPGAISVQVVNMASFFSNFRRFFDKNRPFKPLNGLIGQFLQTNGLEELRCTVHAQEVLELRLAYSSSRYLR